MAIIHADKVSSMADINDALVIIKEVYLREKNWIKAPEAMIQASDLSNEKVSWFIARVNGKPAGILRLAYDPVLAFPEEYAVTLNEGVDLSKLASEGKYVDIGRFMILPEYRKRILVAIRLMRCAILEVLERDYTHFITDVFEGDPTSPLAFHTRILGFEVIGTHLHGELNTSLTRIILVLDILKAYRRIKARRSKLYYSLTDGIHALFDRRLKLSEAAML